MWCAAAAGCHPYSGGDGNEQIQLWAYADAGGGAAAVVGVRTALTTPASDADRRGSGVGLVIGGAVLAILGVA